MIGKLNHVAIAVPNLDAAIETYKTKLGASVSDIIEQKEHGVIIAFIALPNTKIELISPFGDDSPLIKFLQKNPNGGIHHVCYEVEDITETCSSLVKTGAQFNHSFSEPRADAQTRSEGADGVTLEGEFKELDATPPASERHGPDETSRS